MKNQTPIYTRSLVNKFRVGIRNEEEKNHSRFTFKYKTIYANNSGIKCGNYVFKITNTDVHQIWN